MKNRLGKIEERPYGVASTTPPPLPLPCTPELPNLQYNSAKQQKLTCKQSKIKLIVKFLVTLIFS